MPRGGNPVKRHPQHLHPPRPPPHQSAVRDEVDDRGLNKHLGPAEVDDDEDQYSPPEHVHTISPVSLILLQVCRGGARCYQSSAGIGIRSILVQQGQYLVSVLEVQYF